MITNRLSKRIKLYRNQFEDFMFDIFGDHRLERLSIELDGMMFRLKYMTKNNLDLDKIPIIRDEFAKKALEMRKCFAEFMYNFICQVITIPAPFKADDIVDTLTQDVKIDPSFVSFTLDLISDNIDFLNYVDSKIPEDTPFNMFPEKFFRFYTDSYNDGIAKAYPELFDNREQHEVGTGDDADVFVHSLTFQLSERCSLGCFPEGTDIMMADFTHKDISEIQPGDQVMGFEEFNEFGKQRTTQVSTVVAVDSHYESCFRITHPFFKKDLYVTPQHPFLTARGDWVMAKDLRPSDGLVQIMVDPYHYHQADFSSIEYITGYFLGGWLGDGTSTTGGYRTAYQTFRDYYHTRFVTKDHEMNQRMFEYSKILGFKFNLIKFKISTKFDLWVDDALHSGAKDTYDKYWNLVNTTFSDESMMNNPNFLLGFTAGLTDAEGSVQGTAFRIVNTDMTLLSIVEKTLKMLNIKYTYDKVRAGANKPIYTLRIIGGMPEIIKFLISCGTVIPRKRAEYFMNKSLFRSLTGYTIEYVKDAKKVYNFETTTHTYIANRMLVHNCTYCTSGDALVHTPIGYPKRIKNLKEGDEVVGYDEDVYVEMNHLKGIAKEAVRPVKVVKTFQREAETWSLKAPYIRGSLRITPNHKVLTEGGWVEVAKLHEGMKLGFRDGKDIIFTSSWQLCREGSVEPVYNIETESGTYIANGLCIHNCYQFNKSEMRMSFDTAKKFIDNLLADKYGYLNRYNSPAIIIEFIGGEPLLEIKLIRQVYEYFLAECYRLNHPWFLLHRLSICSNGMQYFDKEVQSFFKDYSSQISFNISIDGNKELHDSCRIQPNGEGSYDVDMVALNHYNKHYNPERNSKMTLAPSNIKYLFESVKDFIDHDMSIINLNCVFEEGWTAKHATEEYFQLKKLADYIVENDLEHIYLSIFNERQEGPYDKTHDGSSCGGDGAMLALRPNGQFYPCIRYMPSSVGNNVKDLCMGDVEHGFEERSDNSEVLQLLDNITRRSASTDICWECPIANSCMECMALRHTVYGTPNRRTTFVCIMHIAEALANVYYWNLLISKHPEYDIEPRRLVVPDEWARLILDEDELDLLKLLEASAILTQIEKK